MQNSFSEKLNKNLVELPDKFEFKSYNDDDYSFHGLSKCIISKNGKTLGEKNVVTNISKQGIVDNVSYYTSRDIEVIFDNEVIIPTRKQMYENLYL